MKKITLGFLTSMLTNPIGREILSGIKKELSGYEVDFMTFTGGSLSKKYNKWIDITFNNIYELPSKKRFDALIIYGGSIGQYVDIEEISKFCSLYKDIPIVNISRDIPGVPSVIVSNYTGMYDLTTHLILKHKYTNIAFIKGPENHDEAEERLNGYLDALIKNNIKVCEDMIIPGDFSEYAGVKGVEILLDKRIKIDVIVCVDDDTAFGVIDALNKHNIKVPEEIAVVGFDNGPISGSITPELTTVNQPFFELGREAVKMIFELLNGEELKSPRVLNSRTVIRDSCGCIELLSSHKESVDYDSTEEAYVNKKMIADKLTNKYSKLLQTSEPIIREIVDVFFATLKNEDDKSFYRSFNIFLGKQKSLKRDIDITNEFINYLGTVVKKNSADNHKIIDHMIEEARLRSYLGLYKEDVLKRISAEQHYFTLNQVNQMLHRTMSLQELFTETYNLFPSLGISSCYIILLDNYSSETGRLVFGYNRDGRLDLNSRGISLRSSEVLPDEVFYKIDNTRIITSLAFNKETMGYIVFEIDNEFVDLTHALSWHYSSTLKRIYILDEKEKKSIELQETLRTLRKTQEELIETEKLVSLGNLVAGVAHEINTPLGVGITYTSYIKDEIDDLIKYIDEGKLKKSTLNRYLKSITSASESAMDNLKRTSDLVNSFKNLAVFSSSSDISDFFIKPVIDDTILSLHNRLKKHNHILDIDCPSDLYMHSNLGAVFQVLIGLIDNSLCHGFINTQKGHIVISAAKVKDRIIITYSDDGVGISPEIKNRIFEPFYTTKRNKGFIGLGLNTIYNSVTMLLKGNIDILDQKKGVKIVLNIPQHIDASSLESE